MPDSIAEQKNLAKRINEEISDLFIKFQDNPYYNNSVVLNVLTNICGFALYEDCKNCKLDDTKVLAKFLSEVERKILFFRANEGTTQ